MLGRKHNGVGPAEFWWKEANLRKGKNVVNGATDPWSKVKGEGKALGGNKMEFTEDMDPELQLQMAIQKSLEQPREVVKVPELTDEPTKQESNSVRIQIKLPNGKSVVRRFRKTEDARMIHAVVIDACGGEEGSFLELRSGFPPKVLDSSVSLAELNGASVSCKWVSP